MIKAIIFDMDGVISDSEPLWYKAAQKYLEAMDIILPKPNNRAFKNFVNTKIRGRTQPYVTKIMKNQYGIKGSYKKILSDRLRILFDIYSKELKPIPGAMPLVKLLHRQGYPLLLASSSPRKVINYVMKKLKLKKYFKYIISGDDIQYSKPHPQMFLKGAKLIKEKPANILVIEDSINGIRATHRAGMKCIVFKQSYTPYKYLKTADLVVKSLKDINLITIKNL